MDILINLIAVAVVILLFNFMIFIHELGHFLAAKWRGLQVEKFYIWFGKPIWKKTIKGVEYGIGSIPAGGFVALPQMAPMEAIEGGDSEQRKELPPISPLDKIIVAFAGPLFSFLLALTAAICVWQFGKPADTVPTTEIGYILADSPAEKAGLQLGDQIIAVDGTEVSRFMGGLDGLSENIMLTENKTVSLTVLRDGKKLELTSQFQIDGTSWWQRRAMRKIGVSWADQMILSGVREKSPAKEAGFKAGDQILMVDGVKVFSSPHFNDLLEKKVGQSAVVKVQRKEDGKQVIEELSLRSVVAVDIDTKKSDPEGRVFSLGMGFETSFDTGLVHPTPAQQVKDGVLLMYKTLQAITAKDSNVGIQHLSGPIGIGDAMFSFIRTDEALRRILWFMVVLNINLAIMNLMPLPVLDGGHIVLAIGEAIAGKPVKLRLLEIVQTGFVAVLLTVFVYITSKDIADLPLFSKKEVWGRNGFTWPIGAQETSALEEATTPLSNEN